MIQLIGGGMAGNDQIDEYILISRFLFLYLQYF